MPSADLGATLKTYVYYCCSCLLLPSRRLQFERKRRSRIARGETRQIRDRRGDGRPAAAVLGQESWSAADPSLNWC